MSPQEILAGKRADVFLSLEDIFEEEEDPTWRAKHPLGPVHVRIICKCCGTVIAEDLEKFGWFHNPSFVKAYLHPHYEAHLTNAAVVVS